MSISKPFSYLDEKFQNFLRNEKYVDFARDKLHLSFPDNLIYYQSLKPKDKFIQYFFPLIGMTAAFSGLCHLPPHEHPDTLRDLTIANNCVTLFSGIIGLWVVWKVGYRARLTFCWDVGIFSFEVSANVVGWVLSLFITGTNISQGNGFFPIFIGIVTMINHIVMVLYNTLRFLYRIGVRTYNFCCFGIRTRENTGVKGEEVSKGEVLSPLSIEAGTTGGKERVASLRDDASPGASVPTKTPAVVEAKVVYPPPAQAQAGQPVVYPPPAQAPAGQPVVYPPPAQAQASQPMNSGPPAGAGPLKTFHIQLPAGATPGTYVDALLPGNIQLKVQVPLNYTPGQVVIVQIP